MVPADWGVVVPWITIVVLFVIGYYWGDGSLDQYRKLCKAVPVISTILILATGAWSLQAARWMVTTKALVLGFWLTIPPLWFCFEYFQLYRPLLLKKEEPKQDATVDELRQDGTVDGVGWDQFRYGQEVSAKLWAGVVAFLAALYFK